jgi:hypothetical protein
MSMSIDCVGYVIDYFDSNKNFITQIIQSPTPALSLSFTTRADAHFFGVTVRRSTSSSSLTDFPNYMLEEGNQATAYEPYQGESKSIPFKDSQGNPITVYGGNMNITDGEGSNEMGMVDLGTLDWKKQTNAKKTYFQTATEIADAKPSSGGGDLQGIICSNYHEETWNRVLDKEGYDIHICLGWVGRAFVVIYDTSYADSTAEQFKTAMNGVQLCYELATSTPIYCEPTEIKTLKGSNNVWCDTGDVSVEYPADTKLYIDKLKNAIISLGGNI